MASYSRGRNLVQVGILAVVATVVFALLFLWLTDRGLSLTRSDLYVHLPSAEGLKKGDPVFFRGVPVGEVSSIDFADDDGVVVRNRLKREVPLRADATATLAAVDIFGSQSVVLSGGTAAAPLLADGDTIAGAPAVSVAGLLDMVGGHAEVLGTQAGRLLGDTTIALVHGSLSGAAEATVALQALLDNASTILDAQGGNLAGATGGLRDLLADARATLAVQDANLTGATSGFRTLVSNANTILAGQGGNLTEATGGLAALVSDASAVLAVQDANLTEATTGLKALLTDANAILAIQGANLTEATANAALLTGNLNRATQGEELSLTIANLEQATANLAVMTASMGEASASLGSALEKLNNGQGTAGRLLNDPVLYEQAFAATARLERLLQDVQANPKRYVRFSVF